MAGYSLNFGKADNDFAYRLYSRLLKGGATLSEIAEAAGAGEEVKPADVFRFALTTENEAYQRIVQKVLGHQIPWALRDFRKVTNLETSVRERISASIDRLKNHLSEEGIEEGSDAYVERLASGLLVFLLMPDKKSGVDERGKAYEEIFKRYYDLDAMGLGDFKAWLIAEGGLGLSSFEIILDKEYTALEALRQRRYKCTETTRIYYAILKMAGLKPHILNVLVKDSELTDHQAIGLYLGDEMKIFDPTFASAAGVKSVEALTPERALAAFYVSKRGHAESRWSFREAERFAQTAIKVDPENWYALLTGAMTMLSRNRPVPAVRYIDRAISAEPLKGVLYLERAHARYMMGDYAGAIDDYNMAEKLQGELEDVRYYDKALAYYELEKYYDAMTAQGIAIFNGYDYFKTLYLRISICLRMGSYDSALTHCKTALREKFFDSLPVIWRSVRDFAWFRIKKALKGKKPDGGTPAQGSGSMPPPPVSGPQNSGNVFMSGTQATVFAPSMAAVQGQLIYAGPVMGPSAFVLPLNTIVL